MEVTSHKDSHVPPLIEQELWSILLSGESEIMMCGRLIRESGTSESRRKWTLPTKLPSPPPHRFSRAFVVRTAEMIACVDRQVVLSVGFLWWYHWLGEFIFVLFWSASDSQAPGVTLFRSEKFSQFLPVDCWRIYRWVAGYHRLREMSISNDPLHVSIAVKPSSYVKKIGVGAITHDRSDQGTVDRG